MVKTQVQIPDHLYKEAKRISQEYEMSFAEVVRRGLEKLAPSYPPRAASSKKWTPPKPQNRGWKGLTPVQLKDVAQKTAFEESFD